MPFHDVYKTGEVLAPDLVPVKVDKPGYGEVWDAQLRRHNEISSANAQIERGDYAPDWEYHAIDDPLNKGYEDYILESVNAEQSMHIREDVDRQRKDLELIAASPTSMDFFTTVGAIGTSPVTVLGFLLPSAAALRAPSLLKGAALEGGGATLAVGASEAMLHESQLTRTKTESAYALGASLIVGSALGAWMGKVPAKSVRAAEAEVVEILKVAEGRGAGHVSAGAAATSADSMTYVAGETIGKVSTGGGLNTAVQTTLAKITPINLMYSDVAASRTLAAHMAEVSLKLEGDEVMPVAIESLVKTHHSRKEQVDAALTPMFKQWKSNGNTGNATAFSEAISKGMRRKDPTGDEVVDAMITRYRNEVYDPLAKDAVDIGLITSFDADFKKALVAFRGTPDAPQMHPSQFLEDIEVKIKSGDRYGIDAIDDYIDDLAESGENPRMISLLGGESYLNRVYNTVKIANNEFEFKRILKTHFAKVFGDDLKHGELRVAKLEAKNQAIIDEAATVMRQEQRVVTEIESELATARANYQKGMKPQGKGKAQVSDPALKAEIGRLEARLKRANGTAKKAGDSLEKTKVGTHVARGLERAKASVRELEAKIEDINGIADEVHANIMANGFGKMPAGLQTSKHGALKGRVLDIQDEAIEDFLNNDIQAVAGQYVRQMASDVEMFKRFGTLDFNEIMNESGWHKAWAEKIAANPEKGRKLQVQMKREKEDLLAVYERLRGQRGFASDPSSVLVRAGQMLRANTFMSKLGKMALSALPDLARPSIVHGWGDAARISAKLITDMNLAKMSAEALRKTGIVSELASSSRVMSIAELVDVSALTTGFEKGVTSLSMKFAKATGMTHMNEGTKLFTGVLYQDQAIAAIVRGDWKHRSLKDYGISESVGKRIQNQMGHVEHYEGSVYLPNSIAWDDRGAASAFDAATKKAVDETIITPGIIDRPKWIDHEMGKIVGQFRSFTFASNNRAVLSGLSGHSAHFYGGMAELTFLGLLAYASKGVVSGRSEEVMNTLSGGDVEKLIGEATANSGLGIVPELAQSMAKVLGLGMTSDKYQVRNMTSVIVGANLGAIEDILRVINAASDGEFKESEKRAMVRSIPYNNLAYTDGISRAIYKD